MKIAALKKKKKKKERKEKEEKKKKKKAFLNLPFLTPGKIALYTDTSEVHTDT